MPALWGQLKLKVIRRGYVMARGHVPLCSCRVSWTLSNPRALRSALKCPRRTFLKDNWTLRATASPCHPVCGRTGQKPKGPLNITGYDSMDLHVGGTGPPGTSWLVALSSLKAWTSEVLPRSCWGPARAHDLTLRSPNKVTSTCIKATVHNQVTSWISITWLQLCRSSGVHWQRSWGQTEGLDSTLPLYQSHDLLLITWLPLWPSVRLIHQLIA